MIIRYYCYAPEKCIIIKSDYYNILVETNEILSVECYKQEKSIRMQKKTR